MTKEQIEQAILEQGIRCHHLKAIGYPNSQVQIYTTDAHYTQPDAPRTNINLRVIVEGGKLHVTIYEEVKTITLKANAVIVATESGR